MKHTIKITMLLLAMFLFTQLLGLAVIKAYSPVQKTFFNETTQEFENVTVIKELPYGMQPPEMRPEISLASIITIIIIATAILLLIVKIKARMFLRLWIFFVVLLAIAIVFNAFLSKFFLQAEKELQVLAFILAFPLAFYKLFERNIILHNLTELLIYPGLAAVFVPILNIWATIALLIAIAIYDIYAVWHAGFMQRLAKFQIQQLKVFTGFFVPYIAKKDRLKIAKMKTLAKKRKIKLKDIKIKVNLAILGGGDVTFPLIFAGVILRASGLTQALLIPIMSTLALLLLFAVAKKGKFYPAMLFLSPACILGWLVGLLI